MIINKWILGDTKKLFSSSNISAGTVAGFEILDQNTHTGATTTTMTIAQLAQFTGTNTADDAADTVVLTDAGTVGQVLVVPVYTLAAGTNIFNGNTTAQTVTVTGGTTNTYNMGALLDAADVITGAAATTDVLNITGAAVGSNNITAVDTIGVIIQYDIICSGMIGFIKFTIALYSTARFIWKWSWAQGTYIGL